MCRVIFALPLREAPLARSERYRSYGMYRMGGLFMYKLKHCAAAAAAGFANVTAGTAAFR